MKRLLIKLVVIKICLLTPQFVFAQEWRPVRPGHLYGISGIALQERQSQKTSFLVVHDNKAQGEGRLAMVTLQGQDSPQYVPLNWPATVELPMDLEALTRVPGNESFMALASKGRVYHFQLDPAHQTVILLQAFDLPQIPQGSNFEAFALQTLQGKLLAVWAHRGQADDPAMLYWGILDLATAQLSLQGSVPFKVPFPEGNVRHISDLKVDPAGVLYIAAATDYGSEGPFDSALYVAGAFSVQQDHLSLQPNPALFPLSRFPGHKIEALELVPGATGGVIVATDDENRGASLAGGLVEFDF